MSTKEATSNDDDVGYRKPPRSTQFAKGKSGNPRGRARGSKNTDTLFKEAFDEMVTIKVNGRPRSITKQEMALRQLANNAARGNPKALEILMKYAPVMSEIAPDLIADSDPNCKRRYVPIFPDNGRDPELTACLLKAKREAREKYYEGLRAKEAEHEDNYCTDVDQTSHTEHDE
jgi:Family of unknown function (DUF5681)